MTTQHSSLTDGPRILPAVGTPTIGRQIQGPVRQARLLGAFPRAAYVQVADEEAVAILTRDAVRMPCGLVITAHSVEMPLDRLEGDVLVGRSQVSIGAVTVRLARIRSASTPVGIPTLRAVSHVTAELAGLRLAGHDPAVIADLTRYVDAVPRARQIADALIGAGSGLTPSGDDVLAGFLVASRSVGVPCEALVEEVMRLAPARTVELSASLLACACRGECVPEVSRLLRALCDPTISLTVLDGALGHVVRIGHTSGAALARGVLAACQARLGHP